MTGKNILQYKIEKGLYIRALYRAWRSWNSVNMNALHFTFFPPPVLMSQTQLREQSRSDLKIDHQNCFSY